MGDYPEPIVPVNHVAPVPRRIRAVRNGHTVLDSMAARYVWEWSRYPRYYVPAADVRTELLVAEDETQTAQGLIRSHALQVDGHPRPHAAGLVLASDVPELVGLFRFDWNAMSAWYEEDEQVFVHARDPFVRVDALRSHRRVRVELDGVVLAESNSPVMVFETGLPTRYYLDRTDVDFTHLVPTRTVTSCPYKGTTSGYWSIKIGDKTYPDLAWAYDFPTRQLLPIAGLIAFYNEHVDLFLDGQPIARPVTHF